MGFSFEARLAGIYPKISPMPTDTEKETITAPTVGGASIPIRLPIPYCRGAENDPDHASDGAGNRRLDNKLLQDHPPLGSKAFRIPISLVRSVTETSMIFITPTPATRREIRQSRPTSWTSCRSVRLTNPKASSWPSPYKGFRLTNGHIKRIPKPLYRRPYCPYPRK